MKGAQSLLCECGGFFSLTYERDVLGTHTELFDCKCGMARKIIIDGSIKKVEVIRHGITIKTDKFYGIHKKAHRREI